jgi:thioredoxin-related protein
MKMSYYWRQLDVLLLILACSLAAAAVPARSAPLQYADDLAAVGRQAAATNTPVMLVFTRPDCPYCARAKRDYLEPLSVSDDYGAKVVMREIDTPNERIALRGFDGVMTTHREFARKYGVRMVPTVIVVDSRGTQLADPVVGLNSADFYALYIEQAIDTARGQLRSR